MDSSVSDESLGPEQHDDLTGDFLDDYYSVWDLGPFPDPNPEVAARFDAVERELIELSLKTSQFRLDEMLGALADAEDRDEATRVEMGKHRERVDRIKTVVYQVRTGVDF